MMFSFGQSEHERIEIEVVRYERSRVGDYHDANWLTVQLCVCVGGFRGSVDAAMLTYELVTFLRQLRLLYESLRGTAEFTTMEGQLSLRLVGDGNGHIELRGEVADQPGVGNRLHFTLQIDQSQLGESIHQLEQIALQFPERTV
jgi:hypothetical protein